MRKVVYVEMPPRKNAPRFTEAEMRAKIGDKEYDELLRQIEEQFREDELRGDFI